LDPILTGQRQHALDRLDHLVRNIILDVVPRGWH